jgi:hypothetical protein
LKNNFNYLNLKGSRPACTSRPPGRSFEVQCRNSEQNMCFCCTSPRALIPCGDSTKACFVELLAWPPRRACARHIGQTEAEYWSTPLRDSPPPTLWGAVIRRSQQLSATQHSSYHTAPKKANTCSYFLPLKNPAQKSRKGLPRWDSCMSKYQKIVLDSKSKMWYYIPAWKSPAPKFNFELSVGTFLF